MEIKIPEELKFRVHNGYGLNVYVNGKLKKKVAPTSKPIPYSASTFLINGVKVGDRIKFVLTKGYWSPKEVGTLDEVVADKEIMCFGYDPFLREKEIGFTVYEDVLG